MLTDFMMPGIKRKNESEEGDQKQHEKEDESKSKNDEKEIVRVTPQAWLRCKHGLDLPDMNSLNL